jgi:hypothetical protein
MPTSVEFTGTKSFVLRLRKGSYRFVCDPHSGIMHGSFQGLLSWDCGGAGVLFSPLRSPPRALAVLDSSSSTSARPSAKDRGAATVRKRVCCPHHRRDGQPRAVRDSSGRRRADGEPHSTQRAAMLRRTAPTSAAIAWRSSHCSSRSAGHRSPPVTRSCRGTASAPSKWSTGRCRRAT